jgi:hypothetical protein
MAIVPDLSGNRAGRVGMSNPTQSTEEKRLRDWLQNIVDIYAAASELFTNDEDLAASMCDRAQAALDGKIYGER